jgi:hypothetical protein
VLWDPAPPRDFQMFCCRYHYLGFSHLFQPLTTGILILCEYDYKF